jgi:hypothetical protein
MSQNFPSYKTLTAYYAPLALQAASQSLTYQLVAIVASHGEGGAINLAGVAQSNTLMFLIGTLGAGLMTSGMVHGRTKGGYDRFVSVNTAIALLVALIQALLCIPLFSHFVFGSLLGLPPSIEKPAMLAFPWTIPLNFLFFWRGPYQVILYNNGASGRASIATLSRVAVTLILSPIFSAMGYVGPVWAMICMTLGVAAEVLLSWMFSKSFHSAFEPDRVKPPRRTEIFTFNIPLSIGGFLMTFSGFLMGAFIARANLPEHMLPAYYLAAGVVSPITAAAGRMTNVILRFPPSGKSSVHTLRYAIYSGIAIAALPLIFLIPGIAHWYYIDMQNLNPSDLHLVYGSAFALLAFPLVIAIRSHQEGLAAWSRKTHAILAGNIAYLATLAVFGFEFLALKTPGNLLGPFSIILSNIIGIATVTYMLKFEERKEIAEAVPAIGQDSQ